MSFNPAKNYSVKFFVNKSSYKKKTLFPYPAGNCLYEYAFKSENIIFLLANVIHRSDWQSYLNFF